MSADQGSIEGQIEFAGFLIRGDRIPKAVRESERYLRRAANQGDLRGQMRLGVC
jgi:TPR repeat protein